MLLSGMMPKNKPLPCLVWYRNQVDSQLEDEARQVLLKCGFDYKKSSASKMKEVMGNPLMTKRGIDVRAMITSNYHLSHTESRGGYIMWC